MYIPSPIENELCPGSNSFCHMNTLLATVLSVNKETACNAGDAGDMSLIPGSGRSLEEGMATHFRIFAWRIPWTEEPGGLQSIGRKELDMTKATECSTVLRWAKYLQCGCY